MNYRSLSLRLMIAGLLTACVSTPRPTELPPLPSSAQSKWTGREIAIIFNSAVVPVSGDHHEGVLQVRQPWIFGLSDEQKNLLSVSATTVAQKSFVEELQGAGVKVRTYSAAQQIPKSAPEIWEFEMSNIRIDTFGNGMWGFGSAGNFWRARISVKMSRSGEGKRDLNLEQEAIESPSPAQLSGTYLVNYFTYCANPSLLTLPSASYNIDLTVKSPVDTAMRLIARRFLEQ